MLIVEKLAQTAVFWGRLIPGIRTLISVPAGIELMPLTPFIIWTTAGSLIWTLLLTLAGFFLGESYNNVEIWIEPFSKSIKLIAVLLLIYYLYIYCNLSDLNMLHILTFILVIIIYLTKFYNSFMKKIYHNIIYG